MGFCGESRGFPLAAKCWRRNATEGCDSWRLKERLRTISFIRMQKFLLPMMLAALFFASAMTYAADEQRVPPAPAPPAPVPAMRTMQLHFQQTPASEIIALYRSLIPEELVVDSGIKMGVPLTLETKGEVSQEKAVEMIESTLMLNGYTLLQQAPGTIMVLGPSKFPRSEGTPVYYSPAELPKGERVVTYFMSLTNIKAADAVQLFAAQVSPPNSYTSLITVTNANAVLITESTSVIRQLVGMQPSFDVKSQAAGTR